MVRTTLNNYLLPQQSNSISVRAHHHPAWVAVAGVSRTEIQDHPNGHYCLVSVKSAKQFANVFADMSVVISQDDKAKIDLGIPAVGRSFHTLQSVNEPVYVADHDFPAGNGQNPLVIGTSSLTHMQDLKSLTSDPQYDDALKINREIRPIWILLVDGGPDENSRHLKNIKTYCQLFQKFNLDYLTGIAILSGKLTGIILPINHFGTHLNTQGKVINPELALQNFKYAGEALCDIWRHVLSFGRSVDARYVEELVNLFEDLHFEGIDKENAEQKKKRTKRTKIIQQNVLCRGHRLKIIVTYANILLILNDAQI
ncbi:hypothetical protein RhiirA5_437132 [Rhizophagus irregularis]|uniref:Uncharacterized protein n=1 Tax=Rhizophagus irregularis TaxID=588596 RepID=A0A2N0NKW9_9GLOM|nr:hypothetical protein RhiirA5_437132 [Rhizophagus irregularis]